MTVAARGPKTPHFQDQLLILGIFAKPASAAVSDIEHVHVSALLINAIEHAEPAMLAANRGIDLSNGNPSEPAAPLAARAATLVSAARSKRKTVPKPLLPAVLAGTIAAARLTPNGTAPQSELKKRIVFLWAAQTGRW